MAEILSFTSYPVGRIGQTGTNYYSNCVAFKVSASGATHIDFTIRNISFYERTSSMKLVAEISTDPNKYVNPVMSGTANVNVQYSSSTEGVVVSGSLDYDCLPGATYYLWLHPASDNNGAFGMTGNVTLSSANISESGSYGGIVYIDNGTSYEAYQCYIDNGTSWDLCEAKIDNGAAWEDY